MIKGTQQGKQKRTRRCLMKSKLSWMTVVLAVIMIAALLVSCAPQDAEAPESAQKEVKVGLSGCLTGPIAAMAQHWAYGILDYLRYVNDELGGLEYTTADGKTEYVKLDIAIEDNAHDIGRAIHSYKRLADWGALTMYYGGGGSVVMPILESIHRDKMSGIYGTIAEPHAMAEDPIYTMAESLTYTDEVHVFLDWMMEGWNESRPPRVAIVPVDSPHNRAQLPGINVEYAEKIGAEYVGTEWPQAAVTDFSIELKRLEAAGTDWIYMTHIYSGAAMILKDMARLGLQDKMNICVCSHALDEGMVNLAGEAAEGVYGIAVCAFGWEEVPGVLLSKEIASIYRPEYEVTMVYTRGTTMARVMVESVRSALEEVGYENINREEVWKGLMSINNFDVGGTMPNISIDPEYPILTDQMRFAVIEKGKINPVSDWKTGPYILKGVEPPH